MGLGPFALLSLLYAVVGVRVVYRLVTRWRATFDRAFTSADRALVDEAAFYVLVPISVALHELGHAVAIWAFGGRVEGWGYFVFAGYVRYNPTGFSATERVIVSGAGTLVNLLLVGLAIAIVVGWRPPLRAAINELLLQFSVISLINALIFYPLLDLASGFNGDWTQIYRSGTPILSAAILLVHVALLGGGYWAFRDDRIAAQLAKLTGAPPGMRRRPLGGLQPQQVEPANDDEQALWSAVDRVKSGWSSPVDSLFQRRPGGVLAALAWQTGGSTRSLVIWSPERGPTELNGVLADDEQPPVRRSLGTVNRQFDSRRPSDDQLTLALRLAMEEIDTWTPIRST